MGAAALQRQLAAELEARRHGLSEQERCSADLPVSKLTSGEKEEEETLEATHFPSKPWGPQICQHGEADADASSNYLLEDRE